MARSGVILGGIAAGAAIVGGVYLATHGTAPSGITTLSVPQAASSSYGSTPARRPPGPTVALNPGWLGASQFAVACTIGKTPLLCRLDTGTSTSLVMSEDQARAMGFTPTSSASVDGIGTSGQGFTFTAPVTVGGYSVLVHQGLADPNWSGAPMIGLALLQYLYPSGFVFDTQTMTLHPIANPYAKTLSSAAVGPVLGISAQQLASVHEIVLTARIGTALTPVVLDTGEFYALTISPAFGKTAGVQIIGAGVGAYTTTINLGGVVRQTGGMLNPAWNYIPLVGVPIWRALYPRGFQINFVQMQVQPNAY